MHFQSKYSSGSQRTLAPTMLALSLLIGFVGAVAANTDGTTRPATRSVNGYAMPVMDQGQGDVLILLHGSMSDNRVWRDEVPLLARHFRVIAPTMRYFGTGDWSEHWPSFSNDLLSDDIAALIRDLDVGKVHLVGWSRGARIAHQVALAHPELVRSAYLFEGPAQLQLEPAAREKSNALLKSFWGPVFAQIKGKSEADAVPAFIDAVYGGPGHYDALPDEAKARLQDNARTLTMSAKARNTTYPCEQMRSSPVPTRLAVGTATAPIFRPIVENYTPCLPAGSVVEIDGATHAWPALDPAAFVEAVRAFAAAR